MLGSILPILSTGFVGLWRCYVRLWRCYVRLWRCKATAEPILCPSACPLDHGLCQSWASHVLRTRLACGLTQALCAASQPAEEHRKEYVHPNAKWKYSYDIWGNSVLLMSICGSNVALRKGRNGEARHIGVDFQSPSSFQFLV